MKTTTEKTLFQFIKENLDELIEAKINIENKETGYVYLHVDGTFQEGQNNQYGYREVEAFGGSAENKKDAIRQLQEIIDFAPFDCSFANLKVYLKDK